MSKSVEYREKAAKCQVMAEQCEDDWSREVWLETAQTWLRLGSQADKAIERKSPGQPAPRRTNVLERQNTP